MNKKLYNVNFFPYLIFSIVYIFIFFPYAHLRHDDWMMIQNFKTINTNDLFSGEIRYFLKSEPWFFRPGFGVFIFLFHKILKLNYFWWLITTLALTLSSAFFANKSILNIKKEEKAQYIFPSIFFLCFHFHIGSLLWAGEGVMNCPQLLFLSLSLYFFTKLLTKNENYLDMFFSILFYCISLLFKESSLFLPLLFLGILIYLNKMNRLSKLFPFLIAFIFYLYFRLFQIPMNPGYLPDKRIENYLLPAFYFILSFLFPYIVIRFCNIKFKINFKILAFFPFLGLLIAPHLGHPFFSPGWFLSPGFFFCFILTLFLHPPKNQYFLKLQVLLLLSLIPIFWKLDKIGWWDWKKAEIKMEKIAKEMPESIHQVKILECENSRYPDATFSRVIGGQGHLHHMANYFEKGFETNFIPCETMVTQQDNTLWLRWKFPEIEPVLQ